MLYRSTIIASLLLTCSGTSAAPDTPSFVVTAKCSGERSCVINGRRLPIELTITNQSEENLFLTLEYMRKTGPYTKFTNNDTGNYQYGHIALGDERLLSNYTLLAPKSSTTINYFVYDHQISEDPVEMGCASVTAEFDFYARWGPEYDKNREFNSKANLIIRGRERAVAEKIPNVEKISSGNFSATRCSVANR